MDENCEITRVQSDDDVATLRKLMQQFAATLPKGEICDDAVHHRAALKKYLVGAGALAEAWLFRNGETAVGYVLFYWTFGSFSGNRNLYIEDLFGPGVGRRLLQYVAERARQEGCDKIWLCHPSEYGKLHEHYMTLGFDTEAVGPKWTYMRYELGRVEPLKELSQYWGSRQKMIWSAHFRVELKDRTKREHATDLVWLYQWPIQVGLQIRDLIDRSGFFAWQWRCGVEDATFRNCAPPASRFHAFYRICETNIYRLIAEPELDDLALKLKAWCDENGFELTSRFQPSARQISQSQRGRAPDEFELDVTEAEHDLYDEADRFLQSCEE